MEFSEFRDLQQKHIAKMTKGETHLFTVDLDKYELWDLYLDSFPAGTNEIFRERREYDCSCCRQFVKALGNVVAIKNGKAVTIWDFKTDDEKYQTVLNALSAFVKSKTITEVFVTDVRSIGTESNRETLADGGSVTWNHFHAKLPDNIRVTRSININQVRGQLRDSRNVLERSVRELSMDAVETVLDLIRQNSLYKGEEWSSALTEFSRIQKEYNKLRSEEKKTLYCWTKSVTAGPAISRIKNHSIGKLLMDISDGMELDTAVKKYEDMVAPDNYKRPKAIFTKKMVASAQNTVEELGLTSALGRRYAVAKDITINNVLFANRDARDAMSGDVFGELASEASVVKPKQFSKVDEVPVEKFVKDILPGATELEVLFEGKKESSLVSLIAPKSEDAGKLFKWDNGFSWAYSGNIADSMKQRVKAMGGKVDGDLRFSIQWNDDKDNQDDLDAHCMEPGNYLIHFQNKGVLSPTKGMLDVDIIDPGQNVAVENITWADRRTMKKGTYQFMVHNYSSRGARSGFTAEVEFDGEIHKFSYDKPLRNREKIAVADVKFDGENFTITDKLASSVSSRNLWGLKTNQFCPVSMFMFSPNYWDEQTGIGHRHYFFMLQGCQNDNSPNGFFNEFLREDLMKHKRVFEALGAKMRVADADEQLSGLGFSSTKRDELVCKVKGSFERTIKIVF